MGDGKRAADGDDPVSRVDPRRAKISEFAKIFEAAAYMLLQEGRNERERHQLMGEIICAFGTVFSRLVAGSMPDIGEVKQTCQVLELQTVRRFIEEARGGKKSGVFGDRNGGPTEGGA